MEKKNISLPVAIVLVVIVSGATFLAYKAGSTNYFKDIATGTKLSSSDLSDELVLTQVFGTYNQEKKVSLWEAEDDEFLKYIESFKDLYPVSSGKLTSKVLAREHIKAEGVEKALIVFATSLYQWNYGTEEEMSVARTSIKWKLCSPAVGAAYFTKGKDGWKLDLADKYIRRSGDNCEAVVPKFEKIGKNKIGIIYEQTVSMSFQPTVTSYWLIGLVNDEFSVLFKEFTAEDSQGFGGGRPYIYKSRIRFLDRGNSFYDINMHKYGSDENGKILDEQKNYRLQGTEYVEY